MAANWDEASYIVDEINAKVSSSESSVKGTVTSSESNIKTAISDSEDAIKETINAMDVNMTSNIVNNVTNNIASVSTDINGIPPQSPSSLGFQLNRFNNNVSIHFVYPSDTYIDKKLICTCAGVKIMYKKNANILGPNDPDAILLRDVKRPENALLGVIFEGFTLTDENADYYFQVFPYSDHGVYNLRKENSKRYNLSDPVIYAFEQNFADLNPLTTISYPEGYENSGYEPMNLINDNAGDWMPFLNEILKNYPAMVQKNGRLDYWLKPNDYTKKIDGTVSDYNNTDYSGGAFAWLSKLYIKETYSAVDGVMNMKRLVEISNREFEGSTPIGFYNKQNNVVNGLWIPMGHISEDGKVLISGTDAAPGVGWSDIDDGKNLIESFSQQAVFLGGPIMNVIRDLEYMLFKTTNIQGVGGLGASYNVGELIRENLIFDSFIPGWYGRNWGSQNNYYEDPTYPDNPIFCGKHFHSQVIGSYNTSIVDPYTTIIQNEEYMSPNYKYSPHDVEGYIKTGVVRSNEYQGVWPSKLHKSSDLKLGSQIGNDDGGSSNTGLTDNVCFRTATALGYRLGSKGGYTESGMANISSWYSDIQSEMFSAVECMLLPPEGYTPDFSQLQ